MAMITDLRWGSALALLLLIVPPARAADDPEAIRKATRLLEEISSDPESGIPPTTLREAKGITIIPHIVDNQLGVGRKRGHGVFLRRKENGEWGDPELIHLSGLSVGAEAGRQVTDMVTIYRTKESADHHADHPRFIGASVGFYGSLSHSNQFSGPDLDSKINKGVLTYTRKRGLMVGARIIGERNSGTSPTSPDPKIAAIPRPNTSDTGIKVARTEEPDQNSRPGDNSPEAAQLKRVLTALTSAPTEKVAEEGIKDPEVGPASGVKSLDETSIPR